MLLYVLLCAFVLLSAEGQQPPFDSGHQPQAFQIEPERGYHRPPEWCWESIRVLPLVSAFICSEGRSQKGKTMPQQQQEDPQNPQTVGLAVKAKAEDIQNITLKEAEKLLKGAGRVYTSSWSIPGMPLPFQDGIYEAKDGKLYLVQHWHNGCEFLITKVDLVDAFRWVVANSDKDLGGDDEPQQAFLERIMAKLSAI